MKPLFRIVAIVSFLITFVSCKDEVELPTVITGNAEKINETHTVGCNGNVTDDGGATVFDRGICYCKGEGTPTTSGNYKSGGSGRGSYTCALSNLNNGLFSYCAYATNEAGTAYGEVKTFELADMPIVNTGNYTLDLTTLTAVCQGTVENSGGILTETGICYCTGSSTPTIANNRVKTPDAAQNISVTINNLSYGTSYTYRAYATNSRGTAYGSAKTFTVAPKLPIVTTGNATVSVQSRSAICSGTVTNPGATALTQTGICYLAGGGTPTISNGHIASNGATTNISVSLTDLSLNTTYRYRAFATNADGTSYGETKTFTMPDGKPTVTTGTYSVSMGSGVVCRGTVTNAGASSLTETGICYVTGSGTPTVNGNHIATTNASANINVTIDNLTPNTMYRYRAYATNAQGTAYGETSTFYYYDTPIGAFLGTWNASVSYPFSSASPITWSNVQITQVSGDTVHIKNFGPYGLPCSTWGIYDAVNNCIHIQVGTHLEGSQYYYYNNHFGDTALYCHFTALYKASADAALYELHYHSNGTPYEMLLKFNTYGQLQLFCSTLPSVGGYYANCFSWDFYYVYNGLFTYWGSAIYSSSVTFTRVSGSAGKHRERKTENGERKTENGKRRFYF